MILRVGNVNTSIDPKDKITDEMISPCIFRESKIIAGKSRPVKNFQQATFYDKENGTFPTGWLHYVKDNISRFDKVKVIDERSTRLVSLIPELHVDIPSGIKLRDYQEEAVDEIIKKSRGIIAICTGGGKTIIAAEVIRRLKVRTMFIVPSSILLLQTYDVFADWFGSSQVGMIGDRYRHYDKPVIIATQQSLWSGIKKLDSKLLESISKINVMFIDEGHHTRADISGANTWFKTFEYFENAYYRIALTGTPGQDKSLKRRMLEGATGRVAYSIPASTLIEKGYVTPVNVIFIDVELPKISAFTERAKNAVWHTNYVKNIVNATKRNQAIVSAVEQLIALGRSSYVSVNYVETHGKFIYNILHEKFGNLVAFLHGNVPTDERIDKLTQFKNKKILCVVGTILGEGVDIPSLDAIIMAGGGKSEYLSIQRIGRILRLSKNKKTAYVIDFTDRDKGFNLDSKTARESGVMRKHAIERELTYREEGHTIWLSRTGSITDVELLTEPSLPGATYDLVTQ